MLDIGKKISEKDICPDDLLRGQEQAYMRDIKNLQKQKKQFVKVNCPACASKNFFFVFKKYDFSFQECNICKTIFMSPRPSKKLMSEYYQDSENYKYWAKFIFPRSEKVRKDNIHKLWLSRIKKYLKNKTGSSILEVGSGFGTFGSLIRKDKTFKSYVGLEPSKELFDICIKKGLDVKNLKLEEFSESKKKFDIVTSFEVIEHTFSPYKFLKKIKLNLKKRGLLFLSCPNGKGFDINVLKERSQAIDSEHVNLFNTNSISLLLSKLNFETIDVFTPGRLDAEIVRDEAIKNGFKLDPFLKKILIDSWDELGWSFQKFIAENKMSSHMWVVARSK